MTTLTTSTVTSRDGTKIAVDVAGSGPAVVLVSGGSVDRGSNAKARDTARFAISYAEFPFRRTSDGKFWLRGRSSRSLWCEKSRPA